MPNKKKNGQTDKNKLPKIADMQAEYKNKLERFSLIVLTEKYANLRSLIFEEFFKEKYLAPKKKFDLFFEELLLTITEYKNLYKKNLEVISSCPSDHNKKMMTANLNQLTYESLEHVLLFGTLVCSLNIEVEIKPLMKSDPEFERNFEDLFKEKSVYLGEIRQKFSHALLPIIKNFIKQIKNKEWHVQEQKRSMLMKKYFMLTLLSFFGSDDDPILHKDGTIKYAVPKKPLSTDSIIHKDLALTEMLHLVRHDPSIMMRVIYLENDTLTILVPELMLLRIFQGRLKEAKSLYHQHLSDKNVSKQDHIATVCFSLQELAEAFYQKKNYESALYCYKQELIVLRSERPVEGAVEAIELIGLRVDAITKEHLDILDAAQKRREERQRRQELLLASEPKLTIIGPSSETDNPISPITAASSFDTTGIETSKIKENEAETVEEVKLPKQKTRKAPAVVNDQPVAPPLSSQTANIGFFSQKYRDKNIVAFSNAYIPSSIYFGFFEPVNVPAAITPQRQEHFKSLLEKGYLLSGDGKNQSGIKSYDTKKKDSDGNPIRGLKIKDCSKDYQVIGELVETVTDTEGHDHYLYQFDTFKNHKEQKREMKL